MKSRWDDAEAARYRASYADVSEELALRVYTSRLIGGDPDLVLHGGGNTSVKSRLSDLFGEPVEVIHVKGSGWDLGDIEPPGLPAMRLAPLRRLRELERLDDETMVAEQRRALLDASSPNPSVETLLHAFLSHRFIDHSHADAILTLTDQPDGEQRVRALFGERVAFVPYVMPGFALAKLAAEIAEADPGVEGLVLQKHGLFSFGADARESYERHIALVDSAERAIERERAGKRPLAGKPIDAVARVEDVAPLLRGALAEHPPDAAGPPRRYVLEHRVSEEILEFANAECAAELAASPPITPDHVIRTKGPWLYVPSPPYADPNALAARLSEAVEEYRDRYRAYFERCVATRGVERTPLDPTPRVVVLPGLGIFAAGASRKAARVAADLAEHNIRTKLDATAIGRYEGLPELDLFDMEYWSLEQAKLGKQAPPALAGQIAMVTGAAGAIGEGVAATLLEAGAHVVLCDADEQRLKASAKRLGSAATECIAFDLTDPQAVQRGFDAALRCFGGLDIAVVNAGIARTGRLSEVSDEDFRRAVDVNLTGSFRTVSSAMRVLERQGTGGHIVLVSSKNVLAPGAEFGAYSASKAGAHQLARIAALEGAEHGIRVNMVTPDAVFGSAENRSGLWQEVGPERARARGLAPEQLEDFYRGRNLLKARISPEHVGRAVLFFVTDQTPTTGAVLPVDGGVAGAFPR